MAYGFFSEETATRLLQRLAALESVVFGNGAGGSSQPPETPIYVHNVSGEEIPEYACMQCTGTETIGDRTYIQVDQPADSTGEAGGFLFNNSRSIAIDGNGIGFPGPHVKALGDGSTATAGDRWAPVASQWTIAPDTNGFLICAGDDGVTTDVVRVISIGGGGGATLFRFTLNADWSGGVADADIINMDGTDTGIDDDVRDPLSIFSTLANGDAGLCLRQGGKYYVIQAPCP